MFQRIPYKFAVSTTLIILSLVLAFHVLILSHVIPYTVVWAGKLKSVDEMYLFEIISIGVNLFLLLLILMKANYIRIKLPGKVVQFFLWFFVVLFSLNTIGNLFSESSFETIVFTPVTLLLAILCLRIVSSKQHDFLSH